MAEGGAERASFGKLARNQTKYGTNTKATLTNETYLKHVIRPGDTLQGVALKYATTMEQLRRVNNIWANDSLFLREYLLVPLSRSPLQEAPFTNGDAVSVSAAFGDCEVITRQDLQNSGRMSRSASRDTVTSTRSESDCFTEPSATDYFSKFDNSLAQIRSSVQELDKASNFLEEVDNPLSLLPSRRSQRYGHRPKSRSFDVTFGSEDVAAEPPLMFKSHPRSTHRNIRSSLERLEKTSDDIFQL